MASLLDIIDEELAGAPQSATEQPTNDEQPQDQAPVPPPEWSDIEEQDFQEWYKGWAGEVGINPNPDDPRHFYDYRAAYRANAIPTVQEDGLFHWPSEFKVEGHPRMVVGGVNTKTGEQVGQVADQGGVEVFEGGALNQPMQLGGAGELFGGGASGNEPFGAKSFEQAGRMVLRAVPNMYKAFNDMTFLAGLARPEETPGEKARREVEAGGVSAVTPPAAMEDPRVRLAMMAAEPEVRENIRLVNEYFPEVLDRKASLAEQILTAPAGFAIPMAASALSGGLGLGLTFMTAYGNALEGFEKQGVSESRAREAAMFVALTTTPIEFAGNLIQLGAMKNALGFARNPVKAEAIGLAEAVVESAVGEGVEEFLQQYFEVAGLYYAANPTMSPKDVAKYIFDTFDTQTLEALKAGGLGAASGALLTGAVVGGGKALQEYKIFKDEAADGKLTSEFEKKMGLRPGVVAEGAAEGKSLAQILNEELGIQEEEFLPSPTETIPREMGAQPGEVAEGPLVQAPTEEAEPEELQIIPEFVSMEEATRAGVKATDEEVEQYRTLKQERLDEAEFFTGVGKHKEAAASIREAAKYGRALESWEEPERFAVPPETTAPVRELISYEEPTISKDYSTGITQAQPTQNIVAQPGEKPGKVAMVQIATSATATTGEPDLAASYFDKLYTEREGYERPADFWEVPFWIPTVAKSVKDSDMLVVRDPVAAASQIKSRGYEAVMFSSMDVNKHVIKQIADLVGPSTRIIVGGYVDKSYFKDSPNVEFHDSLESAVQSMGQQVVPGVDTRHFRGTSTIPRLCLSKGCLHKCAFCTIPKGVKAESPESVAVQLENMKGLKFSLVYLDDKTFGQAENFEQIVAIYKQVSTFNPAFQGFVVQTTAPQLLKLDDEFLQKSGIKFVELGVESYNDDILAKIHKPARTKTIDAAVEKLRANKIAFIPNILVGLTGKGWSETAESYKNTLDFLKRNDDIISHVNVYNLALYQGTELAEQLESREDIDIDENKVARSYHKNPKLHEDFYKAVLRFGERQLDKKPFESFVPGEAALTQDETTQMGLFKEKKKAERRVARWVSYEGEEIVDEETGEKTKASILTPEAEEKLTKVGVRVGSGPFPAGSNFLVSITENEDRGGLIYGPAKSTDEKTTRTKDLLHGKETITEYWRKIGGKTFKVLNTVIMPRKKQDRVKLIDKLVSQFKKEADWYPNWVDYMHQFEGKNYPQDKIDRMLMIQSVLSTGASPHVAQTTFGRVMNVLEEHNAVKGGEGHGLTKNMAKKITAIWTGEVSTSLNLAEYQDMYGRKIGAMVFAALHPTTKEGAVVVDRHMARMWGYNAMWGGAFRIPKHLQTEITNDIVEAAQRHDMPIPSVQAALWYATGAGHWGSATHFEEAIRLAPKKSLSWNMVNMVSAEPQAIVSFHGQLFYTVRGAEPSKPLTGPERQRLGDLIEKAQSFSTLGTSGLTTEEAQELLELQHKREGINPNPWSKDDVQARMNAATEDNGYVPMAYWYGPGVRKESYYEDAEPHLTMVFDNEIYDTVEDKLKYVELAHERAANDSEVKKGTRTVDQVYMNTLAGLIKRSGDFKGFSINKNGNTVVMTFDEMVVEEHPKTVTVALSDRVSGLVKLPENLKDLAEQSAEPAKKLLAYLKEGLKDYPIKIKSVAGTLARFESSTSNETEYGISAVVEGPITAIRAAFSDLIGLRKKQNIVLLLEPGKYDGRLVRFQFADKDLAKIDRAIKKSHVQDFNVKFENGAWWYEVFIPSDVENTQEIVDNLINMYQRKGVDGTLEDMTAGVESLTKEPVPDALIPSDYQSHILKYFGRKKGADVYDRASKEGDEWAATSYVVFGAEAARAGKQGKKAGEGRSILERFREPEKPGVGEAKLERVEVGSGFAGHRAIPPQEVDVQVNPSTAQFRGMLNNAVRKHGEHAALRSYITEDGDLYVWDGWDVTHPQVMAAMTPSARRVRRFYTFANEEENSYGGTGTTIHDILGKQTAIRNGKPASAEAKLETVEIRSPVTGIHPLDVQVNPTTSQAEGLLKKSQEGALRGLIDDDGNLYLWDAYDAIHLAVANAYGIKYRATGQLFITGSGKSNVNFPEWRRDTITIAEALELQRNRKEAVGKGVVPVQADFVGDEALLGGRFGIGAPTGKIARAAEMTAKGGYSTKQIWEETGWWLGPDFLWRFEIDDAKMTISKPENWRAPATMRARRPAGWHTPITLGHIMKHDQLFKHYPELADIEIIVVPDLMGGGFSENEGPQGTIYIGSNRFDKEGSFVETLIHEIQHAIQFQEGFAIGTSIDNELVWLERNDPKYYTYSEEKKLELAGARYWAHVGEFEAVDSEERLTWLTSEEKKHTVPYTGGRATFIPRDKWIVRKADGSTSFAINPAQMPSKTLLDYFRGWERAGQAADAVREAATVSGLSKFPEIMQRIDLALKPFIVSRPEDVKLESLESWARVLGITVAEVEANLASGKQRTLGITRFTDPFHAVIALSLEYQHISNAKFQHGTFHEFWHVIEKWFIPDEALAKLEAEFPKGSEQRADAFADYMMGKLEKPASWLAEIFARISMFLKQLKARLVGLNFSHPNEIFEWMARGQFDPLITPRLEYFHNAKVRASHGLLTDLDDMTSGPVDVKTLSRTPEFSFDDEKTGRKRVKELVDEWMRPKAEASLSEAGWTPEKGQADAGQDDVTIPKIIELPEMLQIYKSLLSGKLPGVREKLFGSDSIRGVFIPGRGIVRLQASIFKNPDLAARVLAHEIGHLVDWLPDEILAGGILSKISSIRDFVQNTLPFKPGAPGELTDEDIRRLREEAIQLLGMTQVLRTKWIDTTIQEELKITPEDVLNIWNAVEKAKMFSPDLYKYIAGLDTNAKKLIVRAALKGQLSPEVQNFVKTIAVGTKTKKQVTEVEYVPPTQEAIAKKLAEMIEKEIKARKLWVEDEVRDELKTLSSRWRPFDPQQSPKWFINYRWSSEELYADAISALFNDPQFLRAQAPKFYEAFFNYLDSKKDVKKIYLEIQREIHSGEVDQARTQNFYRMFDEGNDAYAKQYEDLSPSFRDSLKRAFWDGFHMILKDVRKVGEGNIPVDDNPRYKLEEMNYTGSEIESFMTDLYHNVIKPLERVNLKWDREFGLVVLLRRIIHERDKMANPGGFDMQKAMDKLEAMRTSELTDVQWAALKEAVKAFREIHETFFIDKAEQAQVYADDTIKIFRDNTAYATFDVLPYLVERYGRAVATRVYKQIGTLQDIPNPATATIMKDIAFIKAVNKNIAIRAIVKFYQDYERILGIEVKEATRVWDGRSHVIPEPTDPNLGLLVYLYKGKAYGYYLPKGIVDAIYNNHTPYLMTARIFRGLAQPFRKIFTELNYGFWIFNAFFRDAQRMVMALPGYRVDQFAKHWLKGLKPAFKSVFGIPDATVREMLQNHMLISIADVHGLNDEDQQLEKLMKIYHMKPNQVYKKRFLTPFGHLFNWVGNRARLAEWYFSGVGRALERTTKVGAYTYLKEKFPDMPMEVVGHLVRERGGSADFLRAGREQQIYNNFLLFSNTIKEGYRGDIEAFKANPGEFLIKKAAFVFLPKILMWAGLLGFLGPAIKEIFDGVTEYDLTNYLIIPLGRTESGKSVYLRVPTDETSRFLGGILWQILRTPELGITYQGTALFDYMAGQAPTISPGISIITDVIEYASGQNPYDHFYGRHAVGDVEFSAYDRRAHLQFLQYLGQKMGASVVYKFKHDKVDKIAEELESILGFPVSSKVGDFIIQAPDAPVISNILGRFLKVTDYGTREDILREKNKVKRENARGILDAREAAYAVVDGKSPNAEQLLALAQKPDVVNRQMMLALGRKYGMVYFEEWLTAGTNAEKFAVLKTLLEKNALANQDVTGLASPPPQEAPPAPEPVSPYPPLSLKDLVEKEARGK